GLLRSYSYERSGRASGDVHQLRLALTDYEALDRARRYLVVEEVDTRAWLFRQALGSHRQMLAIGTASRPLVERVRDLVQWPTWLEEDWCRGFLAGIFDAEGCRSAFALRISNTDPEILFWTEASARYLGFGVAVDHTRNANGLKCIRICGGLSEHLRFFHLT